MTCISENARPVPRADFRRYDNLHNDGKELIRDWRDRAAASGAEDRFESFIYLWIAFNSWAACVTERDGDRDWLGGLVADPTLNQMFDEQVSSATQTAEYARQFAKLWPIFRASELRRLGIRHLSANLSRPDRILAYRDADARVFAPDCFFEHAEVPLDWGHTLEALYRVRCNLFHGEKSRGSENDRDVVNAAYESLRAFLDESRLFDRGFTEDRSRQRQLPRSSRRSAAGPVDSRSST